MSKVDYSLYFANQSTPIPNPEMTLKESFNIIAYRNKVFDDVQNEMSEISNNAELFFKEIERRVQIKLKSFK